MSGAQLITSIVAYTQIAGIILTFSTHLPFFLPFSFWQYGHISSHCISDLQISPHLSVYLTDIDIDIDIDIEYETSSDSPRLASSCAAAWSAFSLSNKAYPSPMAAKARARIGRNWSFILYTFFNCFKYTNVEISGC